MTEEPPRTPPDEDIVHVDGRAIPFRTWEHELMLRAAAWVAMVQGAALACGVDARWRRSWAGPENWPFLVLAGLMVVGWLCARSREPRVLLAVAGTAFFVALVVPGGLPRLPWFSARPGGIAVVVAAVVYLASGLLLLWRRALARDLLLVLTGAWLVSLGPAVVDAFTRNTNRTAWGMWGGGTVYHLITPSPIEVAFVAASWMFPPAFVLLTMLSRAGRSLFVGGGAAARFAPFATLRHGPPTARGWAALLVVLLAPFGSLATLGDLEKLLRLPW